MRRLERGVNRRLERLGGTVAELGRALDRRQHDVLAALQATRAHVDARLGDQREGLDSMRDAATRLGSTTTRMATRVEELQRLALARTVDPPWRDLWWSAHCGWVPLVVKLPAWLLAGRLPSRLRWWRQARHILRTGLFDPDFYRRRYPAVAALGVSPLYHYVRCGAAEGLDPYAGFDGARYLADFPESLDGGDNPLLHYFRNGFRQVDLGSDEEIGSS